VLQAWQKKKRDIFGGIPKSLPALLQAKLIQERAARNRFDWPGIEGPMAKLGEELGEVRRAIRRGRKRQVALELGDLLFSVVNVSRFLKVDPEAALRQTNCKFVGRFQKVIRALKSRGKDLGQADSAEMDRLWEKAKGPRVRRSVHPKQRC